MVRNEIFVPIPSTLKAEDIASLTPKRQKILFNLLYGEKTLSNLIRDIKMESIDPSTAFKILKELVERKFVQKNPNKVYSLTTEGKLLCLMLAQPNGMSEETIGDILDEILKEDLKIEVGEYRKEIIESWRHLSEILNEKPEKYSKLMEEGYRESSKENVKIAEEMEFFEGEL